MTALPVIRRREFQSAATQRISRRLLSMARPLLPIHVRAGPISYLGCAVLLNLPLLACHPAWPAVDLPWVRSLAVGLVLFVVPGLPWVGAMIGRGWLDRAAWLYVILASLGVFAAVLLGVHLIRLPLSGTAVWNGTWLLTNVAIALSAALGGPPAWGIALRDPFARLGVPAFLAAHLLFFYSAVRVVPFQEDHDFEVLASGYGLLARFEPLQVTDRGTHYQFSHPPLANFYVAGSFLYFDRLDYLEYYDAGSRRARNAGLGLPFEPFGGTVGDLTKGTVDDHRVLRVEGSDYVVDPPLADGSRRIPVWELENTVLVQYYQRDPQRLVARTPNVFLAALTVALLGCWTGRLTGRWSLAVLVPLAYASSPEVFVRSGYGGYFAVSNFAVLLALMPLEQQHNGRRPGPWIDGFLAGGFLAWANHKLILLPAAVVLWQLYRKEATRVLRRISRALLHPVPVGFAAGTAVFWLWGLAIDPAEFFRDHLQTHYLHRLVHHNPLGYADYPGAAGLWIELWRHTGYVLLPLGFATLLLAWRQEKFLLPFSLLSAAVFSLVDWRQTKHLMPLLLPLHVAPAQWAASGGFRLFLVGTVLAGLTVWNVYTLCGLTADFQGFSITPAW